MKKLARQKHLINGFTLIELLVVVAIIALLLAIITPALGKAKAAAQMIICANNQHQVITGVTSYAADNDSKMPPAVADKARPSLLFCHTDPVPSPVYRFLGSYLPAAKIYNCPISTFAKVRIAIGSKEADYQWFYENPQFLQDNNTSLSCSFQLLWNYEFNSNPAVSDKVFIGPGKNSDVKLLVSDTFFFSNQLLGSYQPALNNKWISTHNFRQNNAQVKGDQDFPYKYWSGPNSNISMINTEQALQDIKFNAGYTDGRVVKYNSGDTIKVGKVAGWASYWITTQWY
jgi:prepilin-type N-terminal cleavage/methylation domain-containing protein